jgi:uncharacterized protein (TIGR00369 family)
MDFPNRIPFVESLGFELLAFADGSSEIAHAATPAQLNGWGVQHGGVTMTLLDVAMALAARSLRAGVAPDGRGVVTVEMKTSFLAPAQGRVLARGRVLRRTATMAFCEASLFDGHDTLVAHATGTFKYLDGLPVDGRRVTRQNASD